MLCGGCLTKTSWVLDCYLLDSEEYEVWNRLESSHAFRSPGQVDWAQTILLAYVVQKDLGILGCEDQVLFCRDI